MRFLRFCRKVTFCWLIRKTKFLKNVRGNIPNFKLELFVKNTVFALRLLVMHFTYKCLTLKRIMIVLKKPSGENAYNKAMPTQNRTCIHKKAQPLQNNYRVDCFSLFPYKVHTSNFLKSNLQRRRYVHIDIPFK